jgi:hypothetical protein
LSETDVLLSALEVQLNALKQEGVDPDHLRVILTNVCTIAKMIEPFTNHSGVASRSDSSSEIINVQPLREAALIMTRAANVHCRVEVKLESMQARDALRTFGGSMSTFVEVSVGASDLRLDRGRTKKDGWCRVLLPLSYMVAFVKRADESALVEKGHIVSWFEKHEEPFHIIVGPKQTPKWKVDGWVEMNGFEVTPNIHEEARIIQLRGLGKAMNGRGYLEALTEFVSDEKTRQFLEGELSSLPGWCKPWPVTDAAAAPVIVWCRAWWR